VLKWSIVYTRQAQQDAKKLSDAGLKDRAMQIIKILEQDPYQNPPHFEKLDAELAGAYSRRINMKHRLVYQILKNEKTVKIIRMWTHYE